MTDPNVFGMDDDDFSPFHDEEEWADWELDREMEMEDEYDELV